MTERDGRDDADDSTDDDDASMKAMRAVWLQMRESDEEPPARGMVELLAAARAHAAHRRPSAWQRALTAISDALKRPPVMAFAGIALIVGVAVMVERNRPQDERVNAPMMGAAPAETSAAAPASPPMTVAPAPTPTPIVPSGNTAPAAAAAVGSAAAVPTPSAGEGAAIGEDSLRKDVPMADTAKVDLVPAPRRVTTPAPAPAKPMPAAAPALSKQHAKASSSGMLDGEDDAPAHEQQAAPAQVPPPQAAPAAAPQAAPTREPEQKKVQHAPASFDQLWSDYQAAVGRGDCAAARSLDGQLRAQYADRYRSARANAPASNCVAL